MVIELREAGGHVSPVAGLRARAVIELRVCAVAELREAGEHISPLDAAEHGTAR